MSTKKKLRGSKAQRATSEEPWHAKELRIHTPIRTQMPVDLALHVDEPSSESVRAQLQSFRARATSVYGENDEEVNNRFVPYPHYYGTGNMQMEEVQNLLKFECLCSGLLSSNTTVDCEYVKHAIKQIDWNSNSFVQQLVTEFCKHPSDIIIRFPDWTSRSCFVDLTRDELCKPVRRPVPLTGFRSMFIVAPRDGWCMFSRSEATCFVSTVGNRLRSSSKRERIIPLLAFIAGSEAGEVDCLYNLHKDAKRIACSFPHLPLEYPKALDAYIVLLMKLPRHTAVQDVAYYSVECGEAFEALESPDFRSAFIAYHRGAKFVRDKCLGLRYESFLWNCAGIALKRLGEFDMAERAYLWGLLSPSTCHLDHSLWMSLLSLQHARTMPTQQRVEHDQRYVQQQHAVVALAGRADSSAVKRACSACGEVDGDALGRQLTLLACSKCNSAWYCNRACQQAHWPRHKSDCRRLRKLGEEALS